MLGPPLPTMIWMELGMGDIDGGGGWDGWDCGYGWGVGDMDGVVGMDGGWGGRCDIAYFLNGG